MKKRNDINLYFYYNTLIKSVDIRSIEWSVHWMKIKQKALILFIILNLFLTPQIANAASIYYVNTNEEELLAVNTALAKQETDFTIQYGKAILNDTSFNASKEILASQNGLQDIISSEYGYFTVFDGEGNYYKNSLNNLYQIDIWLKYRETSEQTKYVYDTIHKLIRENIASLKTEYDKAYWAYTYITSQVKYDNSLKKFTAYEALHDKTAVCQGYALLYYAMATELNLNCHIMIGTASGVSHAWNAVELDGKWYYVDTTWGSASPGKYFLNAKQNMPKHILKEEYNHYLDFATADYLKTNRSKTKGVAASNYNVEFDLYKKKKVYTGATYQWMIKNPDHIELTFSSVNNNIVRVDQNGIITAVGNGITVVKAINTELNIEQDCEVTVEPGIDEIKSISDISLTCSKSKALSIQTIPANAEHKDMTFESIDEEIATVSSDGTVYGVSTGSTTIIVSFRAQKIEVGVTVTPYIKKGYHKLNVKVKKSINLFNSVIIDSKASKHVIYI